MDTGPGHVVLDLTRGAATASVVAASFDEAERRGVGVLVVHGHRTARGFAACAESVFGPVVRTAVERGAAGRLVTRCRIATPREALAADLPGASVVVVGAAPLVRHRETDAWPHDLDRPVLVVPRRVPAAGRRGVLLVLDAARPSVVAARAAVVEARTRREPLRIAVHDRVARPALDALGELVGRLRREAEGVVVDVDVVDPDVAAIRSALPGRVLTVVAVSDPVLDAGPQAWIHEGAAVTDLLAPLLLVPDPALTRTELSRSS
ncbi:MAG: hypothetical protein PGN07_08110 [Aeromicrobium erythreum]